MLENNLRMKRKERDTDPTCTQNDDTFTKLIEEAQMTYGFAHKIPPTRLQSLQKQNQYSTQNSDYLSQKDN